MLFLSPECYRESGAGILKAKIPAWNPECCRGTFGTVLKVLFLKNFGDV
jgi:hypothetical protein